MRIDFGPLGILKSTAQITVDHAPEDIIGRRVVAVVNLPPKQVGTHEPLPRSWCRPRGHVGLLSVPDTVPDGTRIH